MNLATFTEEIFNGNFIFYAVLPSPTLLIHRSISKNFGNPAPHLNKPVPMKKFDVHNTAFVFVALPFVITLAFWQIIIRTSISMYKMLVFFLQVDLAGSLVFITFKWLK